MATTNNIKATSYPSFGIGRRGVTIYQGTDTSLISANKGDIFINKNNTLSQYTGTEWKSYIFESSNLDSVSSLVLSNGYIKTTSSGFVVDTIDNLKTDLGLGSAAYVNTGITSGNVPVLDTTGKLPSSIIPSISMTTVSVVENETDKPKSAKVGDVVIVTKSNSTYICTEASTTAPTWVALEVTSNVVSVNSKIGNVILTSDDITSTYAPTNFTVSDTKTITDYISGIDTQLSSYVLKANTGTSISYNVGTSQGQIPLIGSNGKLPSTVIDSSNTITKETSTTNTFPTSPSKNDVLINSTTRSSFIWDGSNWQQLYTPNVVSVNGYTGSSIGSTDGLILLAGNNINGTYTPKNFTLDVDSSSKTIKTLDSYFEGIDNALSKASSGITQVNASQNITASIASNTLTLVGPDLSTYLTSSNAATTYLSLNGGELTGNIQGTSAGFSEKIYAATPESSSNDTSVATTAFVNLHATSYVAFSEFSKLPSSPTIGMIYLVTNGLKPGEETGEGTGVLCVYDGTNWMNISSATTVSI